MLVTEEVGQLFVKMHERPGYPDPVGRGNDKVIDIGFLIRVTLG
jgi:hypothetical protein